MKASELISTLQKMIEKYGDGLMVKYSDDELEDIEGVGFLTDEKVFVVSSINTYDEDEAAGNG